MEIQHGLAVLAPSCPGCHGEEAIKRVFVIPTKAFVKDYGITGVGLSVCYHDN